MLIYQRGLNIVQQLATCENKKEKNIEHGKDNERVISYCIEMFKEYYNWMKKAYIYFQKHLKIQ